MTRFAGSGSPTRSRTPWRSASTPRRWRRGGVATAAKGAVLGFFGAGALGFAGYLGGHLSYAQGIGVDQTVFDTGPADWTDAAGSPSSAEGEVARVIVDDTPGAPRPACRRIHAIHDRCSHRGCSLAERGERLRRRGRLRLPRLALLARDGALLRGPATRPQPAFEVRERDGKVELRASTLTRRRSDRAWARDPSTSAGDMSPKSSA